MPLNRSCSLDALRENIATEIRAGRSRDQAVAIAHSVLREACRDEGKPTPSTKDVSGVARQFRRKPGERTTDYLETALAAAKAKLNHADYAAIHQAARARAGGLATGRTRTSVEKALLLGPQRLTTGELVDALERSEILSASDSRLGVDTGGEYLAQLFWAEKSRRNLKAKKDDPGASDVHVPVTEWKTRKDEMPGGIGDKTKPGDVDPEQLALGIKVEREHTDDPKIAEEIALDHLTEDPSYYTKLAEMEASEKADDPRVMIALRLPKETAKGVALAGGVPLESLHITLACLGRMGELGPAGLMAAADAISTISSTPILRGHLSGIGRFPATDSSDGKDVLVRLVDVPGLTDMRAVLCNALALREVVVDRSHDFTPHLTLAYVDPKKATPHKATLQDVYFDAVVLSVNDSDTVFPLGQPDPLANAKSAADTARDQKAPTTVIVEECSETGEARVLPGTGDDLMDLVAMSAIDVEPGDVVELSTDLTGDLTIERGSVSVLPAGVEHVSKAVADAHEHRLHNTIVPFVGPDNARVVFVSGAPNELELARGEPLVGPDGVAFVERYLAPLGVTKAEVAVGFACPVLPTVPAHALAPTHTAPWAAYVAKELARWPGATVVAVGKAAADALGDRALLWLPHPCAARLNEARYDQQIERKIRRVRKSLDDGFAIVESKTNAQAGQPEIFAGRVGETLEAGPGRAIARVVKAAREKQIVYGVVLDPYMIDTQGEWVPPAVVEATAHDYLKQSRVIGREHTQKDKAELLESWCVHYPTPEDYQAAMSLLPHRAYEMPFGNDKVHSGAWIAGVRLGDAAWEAFKRGEITGFSIGGFSAKTQIDKGSMPKVTFVPLVEGAHG